MPRVPNAIVSAAHRIKPDQYRNLRIPNASWQAEAWRQYDLNGELRFGCTWLGNALSRCRFTAVEVDSFGRILRETENTDVRDLVGGLMGSPGRAAELLMRLGTHMTVPGDCYLLATVGPQGDFDTWTVYSTEEVTSAGSRIRINTGDGHPIEYDIDSILLIRIYRPHPRRSWEADSPTRSALPVLREMEQLTKHIFAVIDSRLAGAGILLLPSELEFPTPSDAVIQQGESPFVALLAEAMMRSIKDRGDARAVVPIVVQGPKDALGTAQWLVSPAQELSAQASDLREKAIRRLALDLDMPPEVLLGVAGSNHWGSWAIEEQGIKLHIEPVMALICSALTEGYLRAALVDSGLDPQKYAIWFDPSGLVLRPNRATDAKDLWDRGVISDSTLRRETGFSEQDAPQGAEAGLKAVEVILKAAPNLGEPLIRVLAELLDLESYGVTPDMLIPAPDPLGGTTPNESVNRAPDPNIDPNAPPDPASDDNEG